MPKQPRAHAAIIIEWANGAQIQHRKPGTIDNWKDCDDPAFVHDWEYRVKPERAYPMLPHDAVVQMADYFCLQMGTIELVSQRTLRHAIDHGQVVTREEFDRAHKDGIRRQLEIIRKLEEAYKRGDMVTISDMRGQA